MLKSAEVLALTPSLVAQNLVGPGLGRVQRKNSEQGLGLQNGTWSWDVEPGRSTGARSKHRDSALGLRTGTPRWHLHPGPGPSTLVFEKGLGAVTRNRNSQVGPGMR